VAGPSPAPLARLSPNGTNPSRRRASPEGACRVEYRRAAIPHPKVLRGRPGRPAACLPQPGPAAARLTMTVIYAVGQDHRYAGNRLQPGHERPVPGWPGIWTTAVTRW